MNEQMFKDIHNWEKEYLSMNNDLNKMIEIYTKN